MVFLGYLHHDSDAVLGYCLLCDWWHWLLLGKEEEVDQEDDQNQRR